MLEISHTSYSYFRPFILERRDSELLEGIGRILGPPSDGFLQFLAYMINLLSNNQLSESDVDRVVQWIDEIRGYNLLSKLLSFKIWTIKAFASNLLPGALRLKNVLLVSALLDAGTNPNSLIGYDKLRPLQYTVLFGNNEILQLLLKFGADVNAPAAIHNGRTALQAASEKGDIKLVQLLLDARADVNALAAKFYGRTALQAALKIGHVEPVRLLLNAGADVNAPASELQGRTALQAASEKGNIELVQLLLDVGADINAPPSYERGVAAIQAAAIKGYIAIVHLLLNAGADVNSASAVHEGRTALEGAAEHGRIDMLQLLINAGAKTIEDGQSQYIRAVKFAEKEGRFAVAEFLRHHRSWTEEDRQIFEDITL
jgi:ankyrin repeat protein